MQTYFKSISLLKEHIKDNYTKKALLLTPNAICQEIRHRNLSCYLHIRVAAVFLGFPVLPGLHSEPPSFPQEVEDGHLLWGLDDWAHAYTKVSPMAGSP